MIGFGTDLCKRAPFVLGVEDETDNILTITVCDSVIGERKIDDGTQSGLAEDSILRNCKPVIPDENRKYEIIFERYIMYQVRNESFCSYDPYEIKKGNYYVIYERSRLLDYLQEFTDCQKCADGTYYPGKWAHYGVISENHIIDIISEYKPEIRQIEGW